MRYKKIKLLILLASVLFFTKSAYSKDAKSILHLEDTEIVTASKEKESSFKAAASIYVVKSDDIRRSGATSVAEALRLVPGLEVARADSNKWTVASRGFGRIYDNKMLVLIDGREINNPVFPATNWDITDVILEDIDQIEVIRGPVSTLWGANTLNGVINIVTKDSRYTQKNYLSLIYGNDQKIAEYRKGSNFGENVFYKMYVKKSSRADSTSIDYLHGTPGAAGDNWFMNKAGFRIDIDKTLRDKITLEGDINSGKINQTLFIPPLERTPIKDTEKVNSFNLDGKWQHDINSTDQTNLHLYIDHSLRDSLLGKVNRNIFNLDNEYQLQTSAKNKLKLGLGYRYIVDRLSDSIINHTVVQSYNPNNDKNQLYTSFLQDTYSIVDEKLDLIIGAKFEHHYYTGYQFMPNVRLKWTPNDTNTIWTSVSSAVREPSKLEHDLRHLSASYGNYPIYWQSNKDFKAERLTSYEVGYRNRSLPNAEFDISAYYNQYKDVRSFEKNFQLDPVNLEYKIYNKAHANISGINSSLNINVLNNWNLVFGYSYTNMKLSFAPDSTDNVSSSDSPRNQFQIQSRLNLTSKLEFDTYFYYVDPIKLIKVNGYTRLDLRLAYKPNSNTELSFVGQKLFRPKNRETARAFYATHDAIGESLYVNLKLKF